jgi:hypothetical protein
MPKLAKTNFDDDADEDIDDDDEKFIEKLNAKLNQAKTEATPQRVASPRMGRSLAPLGSKRHTTFEPALT